MSQIVHLDEDIVMKLKREAKYKRCSLDVLVNQLLRQELFSRKSEKKQERKEIPREKVKEKRPSPKKLSLVSKVVGLFKGKGSGR